MGDSETLRPQRGRAPVTREGKTSWVRRDWTRLLLETIVGEQNRRACLRREDVAAMSVAAAALVAMGEVESGAEWCCRGRAGDAAAGGSRAGPVSPRDIHDSRPMECFTVQMELPVLRDLWSTENRDIPKFVSPLISAQKPKSILGPLTFSSL